MTILNSENYFLFFFSFILIKKYNFLKFDLKKYYIFDNLFQNLKIFGKKY